MRTIIREIWQSVNMQKKDELPKYFKENAKISWKNTNEELSVCEYIDRICSPEVEQNYGMKQIEQTAQNEWTCVVLMYSQAFHQEFKALHLSLWKR